MRLLEYQAQKLFADAGIPVMKHCVVTCEDEVAAALEAGAAPEAGAALAAAGLTCPVVVKAQVQAGGRGKSGGVRFAENPGEVLQHCRDMLRMFIGGHRVDKLMLAEKSRHETEWYLSVMLDRLSKRPMIIFSSEGGVDIEQTAADRPEAVYKTVVDLSVGVREYMARYLLSAAGLPLDYCGRLHDLLCRLYAIFIGYDCLLCEINPLVVSADGALIALDGKMDVDDSALYRHPDIQAYRDEMQEEDFVKEARASGFLYIPVDSGGDITVISNGSGMLMSCIDLITKENMTVRAVLDLGGGATAGRIKEALRIMAAPPGVRSILVNIFGGITRCDEVAHGVALAMPGLPENITVVVRIEGTNKAEGLEVLRGISGSTTGSSWENISAETTAQPAAQTTAQPAAQTTAQPAARTSTEITAQTSRDVVCVDSLQESVWELKERGAAR